MLSAKIKKVNAFQFNHQAGMETLFQNLNLLEHEAGLSEADTLIKLKNDYAAVCGGSLLAIRVLIIDPEDVLLRDFCRTFWGIEPDHAIWPVRKSMTDKEPRLEFEIMTDDLYCGIAFSPQPAVHIFLLRLKHDQIETVMEHFQDGRTPGINILISPDDLHGNAEMTAFLQQTRSCVRCFSCDEWLKLGDSQAAFRHFLGEGGLPGLLVAQSYIRPVRNFGKRLKAFLSDRRGQLELQYQSVAYEKEVAQNGTQHRNIQQETQKRISKMIREQSVFMDQQIDQAGGAPILLEGELPLRSEKLGKKIVWQLHPEFLRDQLRQLTAKEEQIARQVLELHQRFVENLQNDLQEFPTGTTMSAHLNDLIGGGEYAPYPEDYRFEQSGGLTGRVLGGALRPVMMTSMALSMIGTVLGLFSEGLRGISFRTLPIFFGNSIILQILGVILILAIVYIVINNYLTGKKEMGHQYANEHRKLLLRLQVELGRHKDESVKRLKSNYKSLLERGAQRLLSEFEQILERQSAANASQGRERLRTIERQIAVAQNDLKNVIEAERALMLHEETVLEYENLVQQKIKTLPLP